MVVLLALAGAISVLALEGQALAIGGIHVYQRSLAPLAAHVGMRCRFTTSCSRYAEVAIARDGLVQGGWKTIGRIARCW